MKFDFLRVLPEFLRDYTFRYIGNNGDAHFKSVLMDISQTALIQDYQPVLGKWQGIYFMEFDGPQTERRIFLKFLKG